MTPMRPDIPTIASAARTFECLMKALEITNLTSVLALPNGPYTVFAPIDAAFEAFPSGNVDALLTPAYADMLTGVLLYHVVPGIYMTGNLTNEMNITTLVGPK